MSTHRSSTGMPCNMNGPCSVSYVVSIDRPPPRVPSTSCKSREEAVFRESDAELCSAGRTRRPPPRVVAFRASWQFPGSSNAVKRFLRVLAGCPQRPLRFKIFRLATRYSRLVFLRALRGSSLRPLRLKSFSPDPPVLPAQAAIPEVDPVMSNFSIDPDSPLR
jgi:hypothetical protein